MYDVILLLGSNLGDRQTLLCRARALIAQQIGAVVQQSALYESEPWGFRSNSWFINQVIKVNTSLEPEPLLAATQQIETLLGRTARRAQRYASRTIDIDILFFDNRCVDTPGLTIPPPRLHERLFTLLPLHEIAPGLQHPVWQKTIAELLQQCRDSGAVRRLSMDS